MKYNEYIQTQEIEGLKLRLSDIFNKKAAPETSDFLPVIEKVNTILENEDELLRPYDPNGRPGGILVVKKDLPTIIVPDLHARRDFFINLMFYAPFGNQRTVLDLMGENRLQVVCVGDGLHSEGHALQRWKDAFEEFKGGFKKHKHMDGEMRDGFGLMEMVMEVKATFPLQFHFLKGNHENIANEHGEGNYPFRKFAFEGGMVLEYIKKFYTPDFLDGYYRFEKNLPLFVVGRNFLISHAEPSTFYFIDTIIEYRDNPDVIEGLTWTDNNSAEEDSVKRMLDYYIESDYREGSYYFGGHRTINTLYNTRAEGEYVQIHNPRKFVIALMPAEGDINLDQNILEISADSYAKNSGK